MKHFIKITLLLTCLASSSAHAGVGKISSPKVTKGEYEIEYSGTRYGDDGGNGFHNKQSHTYEFEYGLSDRFMLGVEGKSEREPGGKGHAFEGYGLEAQYKLTTQGEWLLSSAIKGEYLHTPRSSSPDEAELKFLAGYTHGPHQLLFNLGLERELGNNRDVSATLESAMQLTHRLNKHVSPGIEWHADYGKLNELGTGDAHYLGPILTGELAEVGEVEIGYTAGYYWGLTDDSADHAARLQLGLEF